MTRRRDLAELEWKFAIGEMSYEDYREAMRGLWGKQPRAADPQVDCRLDFNPEKGVAVRTTLTRGGGLGR